MGCQELGGGWLRCCRFADLAGPQPAADDDHGASFRATLNGTHLGDFAGVPATGRAIEVYLVDFMEIKDGKIVAQWGGPDMRDMLQQLGATLTMDA